MNNPRAAAITPFLMFEGNAEAALNLYCALFKPAEIISLDRYGPNEPGAAGSVRMAVFTLKGQRFMCIDSYVAHEHTFTPALSLYAECDDASEIAHLFAALADGGKVHMPLDNYGFSTQFGWVDDRFGVSWQLNLS
jgi:predicted 3-demethylubiquinone-9 3-methyltransferase (glyoxalase superfamily)